jgi:hypothetical protein
MTYRGRIQNGVVVFETAPQLAEGTEVLVQPEREPAALSEPRPGSPEAILAGRQEWAGDPEELDRLLAEVQEMRDSDLVK